MILSVVLFYTHVIYQFLIGQFKKLRTDIRRTHLQIFMFFYFFHRALVSNFVNL